MRRREVTDCFVPRLLPQSHQLIGSLPRVIFLVKSALQARADADDRIRRLADLGCLRPFGPRSSIPHIDEAQRALWLATDQAEAAWAEVERLGGVIRDREMGFVDFSTTIDEHPVTICWQLGEEDFGWWHALDSPCGDRKPLAGQLLASPR